MELLVWGHSKLRVPLDESGDASRLRREARGLGGDGDAGARVPGVEVVRPP